MADIQITPVKIDNLYDAETLTKTSATETSVSTAQVMYFTVPAGRRNIQRLLILVDNALTDILSVECEAGDLWCASDKTVSIGQGTGMFELETARHIGKDEKISMKLIPKTGKALSGTSSHEAKVAVVLLY